MNNVDRIFSERLEGHTSTPPAGAWEKVEMTLSRRPAASPWLPMAIGRAAILVPVVVAASWMLTRTERVQPQVASENTAASPAPAPAAAAVETKASSEPIAIHRKSARPVALITPTPEPITPILEPVREAVAANPETIAVEEITIEPVELITEVTDPTPAPAAVKEPMVIVITLDAVAEAPDADKKPLERVAEFAMAVKHSDPIGSLRTVKDELLALDLRKKSTKKN